MLFRKPLLLVTVLFLCYFVGAQQTGFQLLSSILAHSNVKKTFLEDTVNKFEHIELENVMHHLDKFLAPHQEEFRALRDHLENFEKQKALSSRKEPPRLHQKRIDPFALLAAIEAKSPQQPFPRLKDSDNTGFCQKDIFTAPIIPVPVHPNVFYGFKVAYQVLVIAAKAANVVCATAPQCPEPVTKYTSCGIKAGLEIADFVVAQGLAEYDFCVGDTTGTLTGAQQKLAQWGYFQMVERKKVLIEQMLGKPFSSNDETIPLLLRLPKSRGGILNEISEIVEAYVETAKELYPSDSRVKSAEALMKRGKDAASTYAGFSPLKLAYKKLQETLFYDQ